MSYAALTHIQYAFIYILEIGKISHASFSHIKTLLLLIRLSLFLNIELNFRVAISHFLVMDLLGKLLNIFAIQFPTNYLKCYVQGFLQLDMAL